MEGSAFQQHQERNSPLHTDCCCPGLSGPSPDFCLVSHRLSTQQLVIALTCKWVTPLFYSELSNCSPTPTPPFQRGGLQGLHEVVSLTSGVSSPSLPCACSPPATLFCCSPTQHPALSLEPLHWLFLQMKDSLLQMLAWLPASPSSSLCLNVTYSTRPTVTT